MAYEPKEWACGEVVTADALNHIEQGIADAGGGSVAPLIVSVSYNEAEDKFCMDKTFGEIRTAFESARPIIVYDRQDANVTINAVNHIKYELGSGEYATGTVEAGQAYNVSVSEAPFTLEALDAKYPAYN